jgi:hypothetical protein
MELLSLFKKIEFLMCIYKEKCMAFQNQFYGKI